MFDSKELVANHQNFSKPTKGIIYRQLAYMFKSLLKIIFSYKGNQVLPDISTFFVIFCKWYLKYSWMQRSQGTTDFVFD